MRAILIAALLLTFAAPALAQEEDDDVPAPPTADAPGVDMGKLDSLKQQLSGQHDNDGQLGKLLRIVNALKDGGKNLTAADIDMLQQVLAGMAANNDNPELSGALMQLGPQLEAIKRQKANPDAGDDDMKGLLGD